MTQKKKLLLMAGGVVVLLALLLIPAIQHRGKVGVRVVAAPKDSAITLDGKPIEAGKVYLTKGTHELKATREHFSPAIKTVNTQDLTPGETIYLLPDPTSPEAKQLLSGDSAAQREREVAGSGEADQTQQDINKKYPFLSKLPYETLEYKIDYGLDANNNLSLQITLHPTGDPVTTPKTYKKELGDFKEEALNYLRSLGVNVNSVPITYTPNPDQ